MDLLLLGFDQMTITLWKVKITDSDQSHNMIVTWLNMRNYTYLIFCRQWSFTVCGMYSIIWKYFTVSSIHFHRSFYNRLFEMNGGVWYEYGWRRHAKFRNGSGQQRWPWMHNVVFIKWIWINILFCFLLIVLHSNWGFVTQVETSLAPKSLRNCAGSVNKEVLLFFKFVVYLSICEYLYLTKVLCKTLWPCVELASELDIFMRHRCPCTISISPWYTKYRKLLSNPICCCSQNLCRMRDCVVLKNMTKGRLQMAFKVEIYSYNGWSKYTVKTGETDVG